MKHLGLGVLAFLFTVLSVSAGACRAKKFRDRRDA